MAEDWEVEIRGMKEQIAVVFGKLDKIEQTQEATLAQLHAINNTLAGWKGWAAGIASVSGVIGYLIGR